MEKLDKYYIKSFDKENATYQGQAKSLLLVVDEQTKLMATLEEGEETIKNTLALIKAMKIYGQEIIATEQYPKGLGPSDPRIRKELADDKFIAKTVFDAARPEVIDLLEKKEIKKVLLAGAEGHVCVYQTARSLLAKGFQVFFVEDAIASFSKEKKTLAARTLETMGAVRASTETILFDLAYDSKDKNFKQISALVKDLRS
ncbi:MAG: isochorismatase family protein [Anaerococcus sp.]|nr:isochorismatase family protein [Anaerococcus sp.]